MQIKHILAGFGILMIGLIACSEALYTPTLEKAGSTEHLNSLLEGRKLYVNSCGSCHSLHRLDEYNSVEWQKNVDRMQRKAKINDSQKQLILEYLNSK